MDIQDHRLLEEALARRTEELAESSEDFQRFAYRVSHDLKEPLRMIALFSQMVAQRNRDTVDAESRTFISYILDGVDRIQRQLHDLLEYAKAGSLEIKRELVDLNVILESVLANLGPMILETGAIVTHETLPTMVVNPDRIRSIFQNLIGNALKYRGADPPRVHLSVRENEAQWTFSVEDNCAGFEIEDLERIFKPFERAAPNIPGSGLGLAIVKRIVELKGVRIWAESAIGKGSTFFFTLPRILERKDVVRVSGPHGMRSGAQAS